MKLDNTDNCPLAAECCGCGSSDDLRVVIFSGSIGVFCDTLCAGCVGMTLETYIATREYERVDAARRVCAHCEHLGIYLDEMADALFRESSA